MEQDDLMAIVNRLDQLIPTLEEPREALVELVREHGPEKTLRAARIAFGSWRTRIDWVEETLRRVLAEHSDSA